MSGSQNYGNIIWTNHALDRLGQRGLSQEMAWQTFQHPETTEKEQGSFKFQKKFQKSTVTLIAKQNEKSEWIVLSAWIHPPLLGSEDFKKQEEYRKYRQTKGLKRILLAFKRQLGF